VQARNATMHLAWNNEWARSATAIERLIMLKTQTKIFAALLSNIFFTFIDES
jgi:hypothetical protein